MEIEDLLAAYLDEKTTNTKKIEIYKKILELVKNQVNIMVQKTEELDKMSNESDER